MRTELGSASRPRAKASVRASVPSGDEPALALSLALDERLLTWQRQGQLGFVLPVGEWAGVLAAAVRATRPSDLIFPSAREARVALFRGLSLDEYLLGQLGLAPAEAEAASSQAGHALPGTSGDAAHRVAPPGSAPGSHLPHAVGAAMAARALGRDEATLALASLAATDSDDCHAALNFAAVFRAPTVFLFRGDGSAVSGSLASGTAVERAKAYAIPTQGVNGADQPAVVRALETALAAARSGGGPQLIEVSRPPLPSVSLSALAAAGRALDLSMARARLGRRPGLASLVAGVFVEPTWPLRDQLLDLAGERVSPSEEI